MRTSLRRGLHWIRACVIVLCLPILGVNAESMPPLVKFAAGSDINEWLVTGPFDSESDASLIDEDLLRPLGMAEDKDADILSIQPAATPATPVIQKLARVSEGLVDLQHIFDRDQLDQAKIKQSGGYLDCIIESDSDQDGYLSIGNADAIKIWLNGDLIHRSEGMAGVGTYDDSIHIKLKRGPNRLRAKVMNVKNGRGIAAHLEKTSAAAARVALKGMRIRPSNLLAKVFVDSRNPLRMSPPGMPREFACGAMILNLDGKPLLELSPKDLSEAGWIPSLPEGLYLFRIVVGGEKYDEPFCIGESGKIFDQLKTEAKSLLDESPRGLSLAGCIARLEILLDPKVKPARFSPTWDRRIMFPLVNMTRIIRQYPPEDPRGKLSGLQIRGFRSKIDDQTQFYRLYIPERVGQETAALPLVIFVPTTTSANRPFIQSPFMAAQSEAERISELAERYRMAVLWCGYRNQPCGLPTELTHIDEVLADIGGLYPIDSKRLFLCGACSGGAVSSIYALDRPGRYAGIGLLNPVFGLHWTAGSRVDFRHFSDFSEYISECNLAPALISKTKIPLLLINDGAEPGHGDLDISKAFAQLAQDNQYPLEFEIRAKPRTQHFDAWERFFVWFSAAAEKSTASDLPSFWRNDTIMAGLARRFIVVEGTSGTAHDAQIIQGISKRFQDAWKQNQYGPCRVVRDIDFKAAAEANSTLVLIGNQKTNSVWANMGANIPIRLGTKTIRLFDREWSGTGLSIIATIRNPQAETGSIILVGAADLNDARFDPLEIGTEGWFSFAVFGRVAGSQQLVDAGRWPKPVQSP